MNIIRQARDKALRDTFLTCSSHPREQQVGDRDLWGCSQLAEMPAGPQCCCFTTQQSWAALPAWFWNYQGILALAALDDPSLVVWITQGFLFHHILLDMTMEWVCMLPKVHMLQERQPNPCLGGIALWHWIWPLNNIFSSCSRWEMKSKHFTSVF